MARGAVGREQFGRNIVQRLPRGQARQHPFDNGSVGMKLAQPAAYDRFRLAPEQVEKGAVRAENFPITRSQDDAHGGLLEQILQLVLPAGEQVNHTALVRKVARDGGKTDQPFPRIAQRRERQGNLDAPAVLAKSRGLEVLDHLAAPDADHEPAELVPLPARQQHTTGSPDDLVRREAEDALRRGVPSGDDPVQPPAEDGVVEIFNHGGELAVQVWPRRRGPRTLCRDFAARRRLMSARYSGHAGNAKHSIPSRHRQHDRECGAACQAL